MLHCTHGVPRCAKAIVANPEELAWSQGEGGKGKRRFRTELQLPSLVRHLDSSIVRNIFTLEVFGD